MKNLFAFVLLLSLSFLFPSGTHAEQLATCNVPADKATITAATNDPNCDIINIASGTYNERITITRNLQLVGNFSSDTTIDGQSGGTVVTINSGLTVALRNITIQNGLANRGGGLFIGNGANVSTDSVVLKDNTATSNGGHIFSQGGVTLLNVTMDNGRAQNGGAIFAEGGDISLENFSVQNNEATENGGGIFGSGQVLLENGFVQSNESGSNGAGIFAKGNVDLNNVNATGNQAQGDGGAIYTESANTTVTNSDNNKLSGNSARRGGAIFGFEGNVEVVNTDITFNIADENGGGIFVSGTSQAVRSGLRALTIRVQNSDIQGNDADIGGAIEVNGTATVRILSSLVFDNKAEAGAGVNMSGGASSLEISNSTLRNNNATEPGDGTDDGDGRGGGIRADGQASIVLSNATLEQNDAKTDGGAIALLNSGVSLSAFGSQLLNNSTFSGNGGGIYAQTNSVTLDKVVLAANRAASSGGGLYLNGTGNSIINSTLSGNSANATGQGSAIWAKALRIDYATIAFNTGTAAIYKDSASDLFLNNTIVHNPTVSNCAGAVGQIRGSSSIDSDSSCTLASSNGNLTSDPLLNATLADNGGNTLTHAIGSNSPANGSGTNCPGVDQRNVTRPVPCDRGAFELTSGLPLAVTVNSTFASGLYVWGPVFLFLGLAFVTFWGIFGRKSSYLPTK